MGGKKKKERKEKRKWLKLQELTYGFWFVLLFTCLFFGPGPYYCYYYGSVIYAEIWNGNLSSIAVVFMGYLGWLHFVLFVCLSAYLFCSELFWLSRVFYVSIWILDFFFYFCGKNSPFHNVNFTNPWPRDVFPPSVFFCLSSEVWILHGRDPSLPWSCLLLDILFSLRLLWLEVYDLFLCVCCCYKGKLLICANWFCMLPHCWIYHW